jgi:DNA (cytosine-5)-methyltransferase 1
MKKFIAIDLFSGCGGLTLGLKQAGFEVLAAIENDLLAATTYAANHPRIPVWNDDIRKVRARHLMRELGLKSGDLDLLAGCPPCQGFSVLRSRNGAAKNRDSRNGLIVHMLRFIRAFRPKTVMLENVPALGMQQPFRKFCRDLKRLGYVVQWDVKDASHYDVPQRRKRLILLAGRGFEIPFANGSADFLTVRQTIGGLAPPELSLDPLHTMPEARSKKVLDLIKSIPKDGGSRTDLPPSRQLACHKRLDGFKDVYGRMAWDAPAPTITSGCHNPSKGRFLHPRENRAITLREAALLQTFPARYWFPADAGKEAVALMIGNALPPSFTRLHARQIAKTLRTIASKVADARR